MISYNRNVDNLGFRGIIGVVVPGTNTSMEPELARLQPLGITNHTTRMDTPNVNLSRSISCLVDAYSRATIASISSLKTINPDCVIVGFSPEIFWDGSESSVKLHSELDSVLGVPAITSIRAFSSALKSISASNISILSPYTKEAGESVSRFFVESGYKVVETRGLGCSSPYEISFVGDVELSAVISEMAEKKLMQ